MLVLLLKCPLMKQDALPQVSDVVLLYLMLHRAKQIKKLSYTFLLYIPAAFSLLTYLPNWTINFTEARDMPVLFVPSHGLNKYLLK